MSICLQSRAALSLLGYCYYQMQDFLNAADCYEQLVQIHPEVDDYKLYHAQSLFKACTYTEAMKATFLIDNPVYQTKVTCLEHLLLKIWYFPLCYGEICMSILPNLCDLVYISHGLEL